MLKKLLFIILPFSSLFAYEHTIKNTLNDPILVHLGVVAGQDSWGMVEAKSEKKIKTVRLHCTDKVEVYVIDNCKTWNKMQIGRGIKLQKIQTDDLELINTDQPVDISGGFYLRGLSPVVAVFSFPFTNNLNNPVFLKFNATPSEVKFVKVPANKMLKVEAEGYLPTDPTQEELAAVNAGKPDIKRDLTICRIKGSSFNEKNYAKKEIPILKRCSGNTYTISRNKQNNITIEISD